MSYGILNQIEVKILFNSNEFPFTPANTLNFIHIVSSTKRALPHLVMSLTDGTRWLMGTSSLADGTRIQITLLSGSRETSQEQTFDFIMTAFREDRAANGTKYTIEGVLNVPKFLLTPTQMKPSGTSSSVLEQIANDCGMTYLGVGTSDTQTWISPGSRYYQFANYVARRGYATENSCMMLALDVSKTLVYRDITSMDTPVETLSLMDITTPGVMPVTGIEPIVMSTALNFIAGYAYTTIEQNLDKSTLNVQQSAVNTSVNEAGTLMMNSDLKSAAGVGGTHFTPIDVGNVHNNYARAYHQNRRVASLFTSGVNVVCPVLSTLKVLDTVTLVTDVVATVDGGAMKAYEGSYRIATRTIYVDQSRIVEKLELMRRTLNATPPGSVSNSESSILTTPQQALAMTQDLTPPIPSLASFSPFDPSIYESWL